MVSVMSSVEAAVGGGTGAGAPPQMDLSGARALLQNGLRMILKAKEAPEALPKKKKRK